MSAMLCALGLAWLTVGAGAAPSRLPSGPIPDGLGVNIHFTDPQQGEMKMLANGGFTWVRMDYDWNQVEYERGRYRFDAYDRLMKALDEHKVRPIFILDYVHRLYDDAQSPHSNEAIAAFAQFAAASAKHFEGRGILWEMYNEPNILPFWRPKVNVDDYVRLATATGKAIRAAAPREAYIGPATSTMDYRFLEACFKGGLLKLWDAVSVHPYRPMAPETVIPDYARLRSLIRTYGPRGKQIRIISGEWGYSSAWGGMSPEKQGKMLPRQWLTNMACDVPLSIWYDWHDDGPDPKEPEHHFGTTLYPTVAGRDPIYDPKPAYVAARTLTTQLRGLRFNKRIVVGDARNHVLLFGKGKDVRIAAWTMGPDPVEVTIPASPGTLEAVDHLGNGLAPVTASGLGAVVRLTDAPTYLWPVGRNRVLERAAAWDRLAEETVVPWAPKVLIGARDGNELVSRTVTIERTQVGMPARLALRVDGAAPIVQETCISVTNPLAVGIRPGSHGSLGVHIANPTGEPLGCVLVLTCRVNDRKKRQVYPLRFASGQKSLDTETTISTGLTPATLVAEIRDNSGRLLLSMPPVSFAPVDDFGRFASGSTPSDYRVAPDGDAKVSSEQAITIQDPPTGPAAKGLRSMRLTYRYSQGWKFVCIRPQTDALRSIDGKPREFGVWIHGDGQGNVPRVRFVDSTQQTWQPDGEPITWTGWRWVTFPLDGTRSGRWGGADDGIIHYPIRWETLFLLDSPGGRATQGEVHIAGPTLIY